MVQAINFEVRPAKLADVHEIAAAHVDSIRSNRLESEPPAAKTMAEQGVQRQEIRTRRHARHRICGVYVPGRQAVVSDELLAQ